MNVWLAEIWRSWRECLRRPGFLVLATGVLALGIGASAGAFALVENFLLKPLPFTHAENVIALAPQGSINVSPSQFHQMQSLQGVASMGLVSDSRQLVNVVAADSRVLAHQAWISADLLQTLGAQPVLGRDFSAREYLANGPSAVLLSDGFWLRQYAGRAGVLGKIIQLDGKASTVVGVLPAEFGVVNDADVIRPLVLEGVPEHDDQTFVALARLDGSRKPAEVAAQASVLINATQASTTDQATKPAQLPVLANNPRRVLSHARSGVLGLLQLCGLLVLLIALVNLVNLMVMRSGSKAHALAVRDSMGAQRLRLALPVLSEGLLVGLLGALFGMAAGRLGMALLQALAPFDWLRQTELHIGAFVWLLAFAVAIAVSGIAALLGLRGARRGGGMDQLREGARSGVDRRTGRLGHLLVIVQMVIATVLLMVTAMLGHAVIGESARSSGFSAEHVLVFKIKPASGEHVFAGSTEMLAQRLVQQLRAIPGVEGLTGVLTALALLLAAAGQYAVMATSVQLREREYGVRMSLGASPARLMREVMHMGMYRIVLGLLVGASLGVALCLALRSLFTLLGRSPIDPWALLVTCSVLVMVGAAACLAPALRAGRVQPMQALRGD